MKKFGAKHLVSAVVATATVVSVGCIAMADEIDTTVDEAAGAVAVAEETAETEEVQVQEEEAAVVDNDEVVADDVVADDVVADETEEVVAEAAEAAEVAEVAEAAEVDEVIEDETVYEVEEVIVSEEADYAVTNGWWQDSYGDWYYYKNGKYVTGWQYIEGKYYYFYSNGEMYTGTRYDSDYKAMFVFGIKGDMQTGWILWEGNWFYCDPKTGKAATGWTLIDGKYYYFYNSTSNPYMYRNGFRTISDETYYFDENGVMQTGWMQLQDDSFYYYYGISSNSWYYFGKDGKAAKGWKKINNQWYYFSKDSSNPYMYSNTVTTVYDEEAGKYYYYAFDADGVMQRNGWYNKYEGQEEYQVYSGGKLIFEGKEQEWYYLGSDGKAVTGWQKIANKYYYFGAEGNSPYARTGVIKDPDSGRYFFCDRETYAMVTNSWGTDGYTYNTPYGTYTEEGDWYYFGSDGAAVRGWKQISNNWYYFGPGNSTNSPYMRRGVCTISDVKYLFGDSGVMRKGGWYQYDGNYYYADNSGALATECWKTINGKTYYFDYYGEMVTGYKYVGGKIRYFGSDGVCRNPV